MSKKIMLFVLTVFSTILNAQSPAVKTAMQDWKTTDGTLAFYWKNITKTDASGNVIIAGAVMNNGFPCIFVKKMTGEGATIWTRQITGATVGVGFVSGLFISSTNDVYITGAISNNSVTPETDCYTAKLASATGSVVWSATYDLAGSHDTGKDIRQNGSDVFVCGASYNSSFNTDFLILKYDAATGSQSWVNSSWGHSSGLDDAAIKVVTSGSNITVTGAVTQSTNNYKVATLSLSQSTGSLLATSIGTAVTTTSVDAVADLVTDAGNAIIAGSQFVTGQGHNFYVQKVAAATLLSAWTYTWNGVANGDDIIKAVAVDNSGNVYVLGFSTSSTLGRELTLIKLNASGVVQATVTSGFSGDDEGTDMAIDVNNNVYVTGYKTTGGKNYYTAKYNSSLSKIWETELDGHHGSDMATNIAVDNDQVFITGQSETTANSFEFLTVKYVQADVTTPTDFNGEVPNPKYLFYANKGQIVDTNYVSVSTSEAKFYTHWANPSFYFRNTSQSYVFAKIDTIDNNLDTLHRIDLGFNFSNESSETYPLEEQSTGYLNYFTAPAGAEGIVDVYGNKRLITPNLYNNIDLMTSSNQNGIKYYFIVKPGGDLRDIKLEFTGATSYSLDGSTNALSLNTPIGSMSFDKPTAYQLTTGNATVAVTGFTPDWTTNGASNKFVFNSGSYTSSLTLVVQVDQGNMAVSTATVGKNVKWSTYYGSNSTDQIKDIKSDANNNLFISGETFSSNLPPGSNVTVYQANKKGGTDAMVAKFKPNGELLWSTFVGGTQYDGFTSLDFEPTTANDIYLVGATNSNNLIRKSKSGATDGGAFVGPTVSGNIMRDGLIFQLTQNGDFSNWLTYYTGNNNDYFTRCKFDANGNFFVVGATTSSNATVVATGGQYNHSYSNPGTTAADGVTDAYIARFNSSSSLTWATCIGSGTGTGSSFSNDEFVDLGFDSNNDVYAVGFSSGTDYPNVSYLGASTNYGISGVSVNGAVTRFSNTGAIKWSSYFGGQGSRLASVKFANNSVYIVGHTLATTLPVTNSGVLYYQGSNAGSDDVFLVGLNVNDQKFHCTYIGGSGSDQAGDLEIDNHGVIYVSGFTSSSTFPAPSGGNPSTLYSAGNAGLNDYFICSMVEFKPDLLWSTCFGGSLGEAGDNLSAELSIDGQNFLHLGGSAGQGTTPYPGNDGGGLPVHYFPNSSGGTDGTITRFDMVAVQLVGVKETKIEGQDMTVSVFPNPAQSTVTIKVDESIKNPVFHVMNTMGQTLLNGKINGIFTTLDIQSLANGVYIISITGENKTGSVKFVKHD